MLILNRKAGESIILNEEIEVTILEITDGKIKLGIEAPKNVTILRKEVYEAVRAENEASVNISADIMKALKDIKK